MYFNFKEYLNFSNSEKNGIFVLVILIVLSFFTPLLIDYFHKNEVVDYSEFEKEIDALEKSRQTEKKNIQNFKLFYFNPNTLSSEKWKLLGFTDKQIKIIKNYIKKGGEFKKPSDLKKIYSIKSGEYDRIKDYVRFDKTPSVNNKVNLFNFDPNTISVKKWQLLGFSEKQIQVIKNYLKKGGQFKKAEDLKKIYSIKEKDYLRIKKYIKIKNITSTKLCAFNPNIYTNKQWAKLGLKWASIKKIIQFKKEGKTFKLKQDLKPFVPKEIYSTIEPFIKIEQKTGNVNDEKTNLIDINNINIAGLLEKCNLTHSQAASVIKYRTMLGGYYTKKQLLEAYNITNAIYEDLQNKIIINTKLIIKIDINKASFKDLLKHPYINYNDTKAISKYKQTRLKIKNISEIFDNKCVSEEVYLKIKHYLFVQ